MKIELQGADNARNFIGIKNSHGMTMINPAFIRSNLLNMIDDRDISILKDKYKLKKIIDLRTEMEVHEKPDVAIPGVEYINIPLFKESAIGLTHEEGTDKCVMKDGHLLDMKALYARLIQDEYSVQQLAKVMRIIVDCAEDKDSGAVLWHCTEGKDRCGIVSAMFLGMLGIDTEMIMQDYLETNQVAVKRAEQFYQHVLAVTDSVEQANKSKGAFLASEDYLNAALSVIAEKYHTIQNFISQKLNISEEEMDSLRGICFNKNCCCDDKECR